MEEYTYRVIQKCISRSSSKSRGATIWTELCEDQPGIRKTLCLLSLLLLRGLDIYLEVLGLGGACSHRLSRTLLLTGPSIIIDYEEDLSAVKELHCCNASAADVKGLNNNNFTTFLKQFKSVMAS